MANIRFRHIKWLVDIIMRSHNKLYCTDILLCCCQVPTVVKQREDPSDRRLHQPVHTEPRPLHDEVHRAAVPEGLHLSAAEGTGADRAGVLDAQRPSPGRTDLPLLEVRYHRRSPLPSTLRIPFIHINLIQKYVVKFSIKSNSSVFDSF